MYRELGGEKQGLHPRMGCEHHECRSDMAAGDPAGQPRKRNCSISGTLQHSEPPNTTRDYGRLWVKGVRRSLLGSRSSVLRFAGYEGLHAMEQKLTHNK
jgi:hypothetical protein